MFNGIVKAPSRVVTTSRPTSLKHILPSTIASINFPFSSVRVEKLNGLWPGLDQQRCPGTL